MKLFLLLILIFALNSIGFGQQIIVRDTVKSEILRQTRHINVVVPALPSRQSDCKMNVVYVLVMMLLLIWLRLIWLLSAIWIMRFLLFWSWGLFLKIPVWMILWWVIRIGKQDVHRNF